MAMPLFPCHRCRRHVRDVRCPFCAATNVAPRPAPKRSTRGLTRAAIVLSAAVGATGCAASTTPAGPDGSVDAGISPVDAGSTPGDDAGEDAGHDAGGF